MATTAALHMQLGVLPTGLWVADWGGGTDARLYLRPAPGDDIGDDDLDAALGLSTYDVRTGIGIFQKQM